MCDRFGRNQVDWMTKDVGFIGRLENIDEDFSRLCQILDIPNVKLIKEANVPHEHYSTYYTGGLKKQALIHYQPDTTTFGYKFEEV